MPYSGRKKAALTYVATYAFGCFTKHWNNFQILLVGRIFCGVATSLLYSAFESWLVAEHFKVVSSASSGESCCWSCAVALPVCQLVCQLVCLHGYMPALCFNTPASMSCCSRNPLVLMPHLSRGRSSHVLMLPLTQQPRS